MSLHKRINAFVQLGKFLAQFKIAEKNESINEINTKFYTDFDELIIRQKALNGWFTKENVLSAIDGVASWLTLTKLNDWMEAYPTSENQQKTIGIVMAGNIPLVGFHDFLCVLITGNTLQAKLSSSDSTLIKKIGELLVFVEPSFKGKINFVERLENFDKVIATGSNNTARYFEQYFGKYPHIIRKSRNSVAIIHEKDSTEDLKQLGNDVFQYFGLGCRNVSKIYFPTAYPIKTFFESIYADFQNVTENNKYANNYDYNKAVYLLGNNPLLDNGFLLLKEDASLNSPVGVLHYEFYNNLEDVKLKVEKEIEQIQCIVSSSNTKIKGVEFGQTQSPQLGDYADNIDVINFLLN